MALPASAWVKNVAPLPIHSVGAGLKPAPLGFSDKNGGLKPLDRCIIIMHTKAYDLAYVIGEVIL